VPDHPDWQTLKLATAYADSGLFAWRKDGFGHVQAAAWPGERWNVSRESDVQSIRATSIAPGRSR
jgi:hypothetical protein